jgi:GTP cyclohydrolase II
MLFVFISLKKQMSRKKIIAGISLLALAGVIIYLRRRRRIYIMNELKTEQVAEHGYETAHDILFPKKKKRIKKYRDEHR